MEEFKKEVEKHKDKKILSNEDKATLGALGAFTVVDYLLPKEPPSEGTPQIEAAIIWLFYWFRVSLFIAIPFYLFAYFGVIGFPYLFGFDEPENPIMWAKIITFTFFGLLLCYSTIRMYAHKQYLSIVVMSVVLFILTHFFTEHILS